MVYWKKDVPGRRPLDAIDIARTAIDAASDKQASNIVLLDVHGVCSFADYFVICTAESERQMRTVLEVIHQTLKDAGIRPHHEEGGTESRWLLLDYGDVVIHIFGPEERDYYNLEGLWQDGKTLLRMQ